MNARDRNYRAIVYLVQKNKKIGKLEQFFFWVFENFFKIFSENYFLQKQTLFIWNERRSSADFNTDYFNFIAPILRILYHI